MNEPERHTTSWEGYVKIELEEANKKAAQKQVWFSLDLKNKISEELLNSFKLHHLMLKGTPVNLIKDASEKYHSYLIIIGICGKQFHVNLWIKLLKSN